MPRGRAEDVADELARRITAGELAAGARLPTHRELAREHGIALETATRVYRRLAHMGLTVGEAGRGTYVREQMAPLDLGTGAPRSAATVNLATNEPLAPEQGEQLRRALRELASAGHLESLLYQEPPGGREKDRRHVATYLLERGIDVPPANVLLTNGSQQGLDAALDATTAPGDAIAIGDLSYPGMRMLAESRRHELVPVPVGAEGPDLDALERVCASRRVRAIYTEPTMHNPLSWVLDLQTRARIVEIARRHDLQIIEDGTYAFLAPEAPPPIQALAPERTSYVASLSKNVATGLRFGFVVAPDALLPSLVAGLRASTFGAPSLVTAIAVGWIADGTVAGLEAARRADAARRQRVLRESLGDVPLVTRPSSYIAWLPMPEGLRADALEAALADEGIAVGSGARYATNGRIPRAVRLAIGTPPIDALRLALDTVRHTLARLA